MMNAVTDEALMKLVSAGVNREAMSELIQRHKERAYMLALKLVGDTEDAKDASQEAFVKLFVKADKYNSDRPFWPWFATILRNCVRDIQRGRMRFGKLDAENLIHNIEDAKADPTTAARSAELWRRVLLLPPKLKNVIVLRHFEDMSYRQIADVLDVPTNTVATWLHQAREKLVEQDDV
jgi:RNA polymerase sigma factor (sigma-70 family)